MYSTVVINLRSDKLVVGFYYPWNPLVEELSSQAVAFPKISER